MRAASDEPRQAATSGQPDRRTRGGDVHLRRLQAGEQLGEVDLAGVWDRPGVLLDERTQARLLVSRQRPELDAFGPEVRPASLHQRQHLQHAVVHDTGQPLPFGCSGGVTLREVAVTSGLLEHPRQVPDHHAPDHRERPNRANGRLRFWHSHRFELRMRRNRVSTFWGHSVTYLITYI